MHVTPYGSQIEVLAGFALDNHRIHALSGAGEVHGRNFSWRHDTCCAARPSVTPATGSHGLQGDFADLQRDDFAFSGCIAFRSRDDHRFGGCGNAVYIIA